MLTKVIREIEAASGTLSLRELGARLGVEQSALAGMLEFWMQKGRLRLEGGTDGLGAACAGACSTSCPGPAECALFVKLPKMYELRIAD